MYRQTQLAFSEVSDRTEFGYWYWATDSQNGTTYQSGDQDTVRNGFASEGALPNTEDKDYRAVASNPPVFGLAVDLGEVDTAPAGALFTIGLAQANAIQYATKDGTVVLPALWSSYFSNDLDAVCTALR